MRLLLCLTTLLLFAEDISSHYVDYADTIGSDDTFKFAWSVSDEEQKIKFTLDVKTTGWVAMGISPTGQMPTADMYIGYVKKDGTVVMYDGYALGRSQPTDDKTLGGTNDITDVSGKIVGGRTQISFTRKFNTGDKFDLEIKTGDTLNLLFAYRAGGNPETEGGSYLIHSGKYNKKMVLAPKAGQSTTQESLEVFFKNQTDVKKMTIKYDNYQVPSDETSYTCVYFNINEAVTKLFNADKNDYSYHAVGIEPLIDNMAVVHHIVIYACNRDSVFYNKRPYDCPGIDPDCQTITYAWAVGQEQFKTPAEAGIRWGTQDTYFISMQIHYTNPTNLIGYRDSSGINVYVTPKLRKYDLGFGMYGSVTSDIFIPARTKNTVVNNKCRPESTMQLPSEGMIVRYFLTHAHKLGRKIRAEITFPNGTIDTTTFRVDNFDYNHQEIIPLKSPYVIGKNTTINTICEYDSTDSPKNVTGGLETDDEMCIMFFLYYPVENGFLVCGSEKYNETYYSGDYAKLGKSFERVYTPEYAYLTSKKLNLPLVLGLLLILLNL